MGQAADFFVSCTSADRAWAEWIAWQLETEGYTVVVQAWDFREVVPVPVEVEVAVPA